ncbi:MAG: hypothetical protein GKR93_10940 [Gammaproteobacteria bacterium]|nr:hypothetical protein [Gammaproteobacteria bacterium]
MNDTTPAISTQTLRIKSRLNDNVWLSDAGGHQVHKFSHDGELLRSLGEAGIQGNDNRHFAQPTDIAADAEGNIYLVDIAAKRVSKFLKTIQ